MAIKTLLTKLKIKPKRLELYEQAFTHPSFHKGTDTLSDYDRLEFMGDAFINMMVAELVFRLKRDWSEGDMSKTRAKFVQTEGLFPLIEHLKLDEHIRFGPSMQAHIIKQSKLIHEKVFEALVGAIYIDVGYKVASTFVESIFKDAINKVKQDEVTDFKTKLQELVQGTTRGDLKYVTVSENGPSHQKVFKVQVIYDGVVLGEGEGNNRKVAEQNAAEKALTKLVKTDQVLNFKGKLQSYAQKQKLGEVTYQVLSEEGPPHARIFTVQVQLNQQQLGIGKGAKKKEAEQEAAEATLRKLKVFL
jgi:ribonuclease-3